MSITVDGDSLDSSQSNFTPEQYTPEAITKDLRCQVTITGSNFVNGQALRATKFITYPIANATGMEQLNNRLFYVQQSTADTFILSDVGSLPIDSRNYTTYIQGGQFTLTGPRLYVNNPAPPPPPPVPNPFGEL